jgi:hypothetical protein
MATQPRRSTTYPSTRFTVRTAAAIALIGACALSAVTTFDAGAANKALDGKKVKTLTLVTSTGTQDHDSDLITDLAKDPLGAGGDRAVCRPPRCSALTFVYKPAKGVRPAPVGFQISWKVPVDDMDLYVAEVVAGSRTSIAHCGGSAGTSEKIVLDAGVLRPGHTYALVADHYRSVADTVTASVSFPSTVPVKSTVPAAEDELLNVNCGL